MILINRVKTALKVTKHPTLNYDQSQYYKILFTGYHEKMQKYFCGFQGYMISVP